MTLKKIITILFLSVSVFTTFAQSAAVKKAAESVFTLTTFKADGSLLASSHGVFIGSNGECASNLSPFIGAKSAVVIDSKGKKYEVSRMIGVNDIYDVAKFRINASIKSMSAISTSIAAGTNLWLVPYTNKSDKPVRASVKNVEKFMDKYYYYILSADVPANMEACPFVNENGQMVGLMQRSTTSNDIYATDVNFIKTLSASGLTLFSGTLAKIGIPGVMPEDISQAQLVLMLASQAKDSLKYATATTDFLSMFPTLIDGYTAKAQWCVDNNHFDEARKCMEKAIATVSEKDDAHYNYAKIIYAKELYKSEKYLQWSYDKALDETAAAYAINPLPLYKDLEGQIRYAKGDYQKAYDIFMSLTDSKLKSSELFYNAALCKQQLNASDTEVIALLDSAVNNVDSLNIRDAAKYFLLRGDIYNKMNNYRQAVFDYTRYEVISGRNVNANFYYIREQAEVKAKLFKQALADIDNAIYLDSKEPTFQAEKASLLLRLNMFDEAAKSAKMCIETAPDFSDAYLVLGLAQIKTGNKAEGVANLNKAKDMGNTQAPALIDKYGK